MSSEAPPGKPRVRAKRGKNVQRIGYRRIVQLLVYLIIVPTVLILSLGIILMFLEGTINVLFGILTVSFVGVMGTGIVLTLVFVRREANLSELQADFVSKVSHELKTPLTSIRLFIETMQRSSDDPAKQAECLKHLSAESERLTRHIERLLDWGRMEAGRKLYRLAPERVRDVVDEALLVFGPERYKASELELEVVVEDDLPEVLADRGALADALANLLSNAQKYGGTPARVRLVAHRGPHNTVAFRVIDNGEGIPAPERQRIFDKFYRIDDRLSRSKEGSGLGLAIVKHVAHAHGARVGVESTIGTGSTFSLVFDGCDRDALARDAEAR